MTERTQGTATAGLADSLRESLHDISAQAREETVQMAADARREVRGMLRRRKDRVAAHLGDAAAALRDAGRRLDSEGGQGLGEELRECAERAAHQVERAASYVRENEVRDLVRDFEDAARARPAWFLAGSFVAGALVARFLKSSSERAAKRQWVATSLPPVVSVSPNAGAVPVGAIDLGSGGGPEPAVWPQAGRRP
jgi:hypothetical protein